jgi:L-aspartate-alpha-decarboxylase
MQSKLHNGVVTGANLDYEGSVTIGKGLLNLSRIKPYERVQVLNITNGNRIETYVIPGNWREINLNGAAAHLFKKGDRIIIIAYRYCKTGWWRAFIPYPKSRRIILDGSKENYLYQEYYGDKLIK